MKANIPTSLTNVHLTGIANFAFGVVNRNWACPAMPMPPPITTPSAITATGFR